MSISKTILRGFQKLENSAFIVDDNIYHFLNPLICLPANLSSTMINDTSSFILTFYPRTLICAVSPILLIKKYSCVLQHALIPTDSEASSTAANWQAVLNSAADVFCLTGSIKNFVCLFECVQQASLSLQIKLIYTFSYLFDFPNVV